MFIELEDVKSINDTLGRKYGDEVLIQASRRLIHCKRESDTLARFGDHQFALILEHLSSDEETDMIAQRIHASLSKPFQINGHRFNVDPRMGVCLGNELTTSNNISNVEIATCYSRKKIIEIKQHDYQLAQ
jgi:diguanylate cyclase (GGDEF)-like protein